MNKRETETIKLAAASPGNEEQAKIQADALRNHAEAMEAKSRLELATKKICKLQLKSSGIPCPNGSLAFPWPSPRSWPKALAGWVFNLFLYGAFGKDAADMVADVQALCPKQKAVATFGQEVLIGCILGGFYRPPQFLGFIKDTLI